MGKRIVGFILGIGMSAFAVMAYFSGEDSSKTTQGHIIILVVFLMGLTMALNALTTKPKPVASVASVNPVPVGPSCPSCHKAISAEYAVCPYCGTVLKPKCPHCGKEVAHDFKNCPYCGTSLNQP